MHVPRRLALIAPLLVLACGGATEPTPPVVPAPIPVAPPAPSFPPPPATTPGEIGVDLAALDRSVDPCNDFYAFACGGWQKATPIPEDQATWGRSFSVIQERNEEMLRGFLEKDASAPGADPYSKALGDFYASCMDEAAIEKEGTLPIKADLALIAQVKDATSLERAVVRLHKVGARPIFEYSSQQDFQDASQVIAAIDQSGLGLPDRDYYLAETPSMKDIRAKYEAHVEALLTLAGDTPAVAKKERQAVMAIETALAKASMDKVERRDPKNVYHRSDEAGVKRAAPQFPWNAYLKDSGTPAPGVVNIVAPDFLKAVGGMVASVPMADWRAYLRWHLVAYAAPRLGPKFVDEDFAFRRVFSGAAKLLPRWKRCVRAIDADMGEALGRPFAAAMLGEEGKTTARSLIGAIEAAMRVDLERLPWMDDATRARALEKLSRVDNKVGFPDKWRNYDALKIERVSYLGNVMRAAAFETKRQLDKIGKPVDRSEWQMSPPTVNAYYEPNLNEMVFPAGILQPPFYANKATVPLNFGGIGMVMGHELTHGFDDSGRKFDAAGNLKDWWTESVGKEFERRAQCVVDQFDAYQPLPDAHIKGKLTLGENIADLGGLKLAHAALVHARGDRPMTVKDGFTEDQQFFLGYAQSWCTNMRDEYLRLMVNVNPHSPARWRVIGPTSNMASFAKAFSCKEGSPMVRPAAQRCEVW